MDTNEYDLSELSFTEECLPCACVLLLVALFFGQIRVGQLRWKRGAGGGLCIDKRFITVKSVATMRLRWSHVVHLIHNSYYSWCVPLPFQFPLPTHILLFSSLLYNSGFVSPPHIPQHQTNIQHGCGLRHPVADTVAGRRWSA